YSEPGAYISIAEVTEDGMQPFSGDAGQIRVLDSTGQSQDLITVSAPGGSGSVYLGARTLDIEATENTDESDRAILAAGLPGGGFGTFLPPQPGNILKAGLTVANGHSLGAFLLGGTFTGFANFTGSIGEFYAGWLITGETRGESGSNVSFADNFFVNGDAHSILTQGPVGS